MKFAIAIPSRYESTRFPGKALYPICGVPLVIRVVRQCLKAAELKSVYVVTEDKQVADCVTKHGYQVLMDETRASSGTEKIVQVMDQIDADRIINVQGDEAVVNPATIAKLMVESVRYPDWVIQACYTSATPGGKGSVKIVTDLSGSILYMSRSEIPFNAGKFKLFLGVMSQSRAQLERYAVRKERYPLEDAEDIELLRFLELGQKILAVEGFAAPSVNFPSDVPAIEEIIQREGL